jgi:glycerophosphoryl diester phosphodiesterase
MISVKCNILNNRYILILFFPLFLQSASGQDLNALSVFSPPKNGTYVIAHRGAHKNIPENTLAAYQKAIDLGCDFVEIDTRTTSDGRIVSMHNASVNEYVKGASGKVSDMTFEQIRELDLGAGYGENMKGTQVPSFEEILQLCKGKIGIYLDLKAASIPELVKFIKEYNMERKIIWYIPANRTDEISQLDRECQDCIVTPDPGKEENLDEVIKSIRPHVIATDMGVLTESFVSKSHNGNALVFCDEDKGTTDEWSKMIRWKTDGIQTDDPEGLIRFLKARNDLINTGTLAFIHK